MTYLSHSYHTARKEHYCENCGKPIRLGQRYRRRASLIEGTDFYEAKEHEHCVALCEDLLSHTGDDEYVYLMDWEGCYGRNDLLGHLWIRRDAIMEVNDGA